MTVFERAESWAVDNFKRLRGKAWTHDALQSELQRLLPQYQGIETKRWLFVYSPESVNSVFEVSEHLPGIMMALTKLLTVAEYGGMLFGADFSEGWGTPKCVGKFVPLAICKPLPENPS